jgi:valyl-tRNA synthetase
VRLLHPFLPFVTEEIAAQYDAAPLLAASRWRDAHAAPSSAADQETIGRLQAAIQALRVYRADTGVAPGRVLTTRFVADDSGAAELYGFFADVLRSLAKVEPVADAAPSGAGDNVVLVPGGRFEILVDEAGREQETARLRGQLAKLDEQVGHSEKKLANEVFVDRAPAAVVEKERVRLAGALADRDEVAARLADLERS